MSEEWGPWIEHDGGFVPHLAGYWVEGDEVFHTFVRRDEWRVETGFGASWNWANWPEFSKIIRYRIRKPRGLTILEGLLENLPEHVDA
jgi:hypothetical protein